MPLPEIRLPTGFTTDHEQSVIDYLSGRLRGREAWRRAFAAFDLLDEALLVTAESRHTFRTLYLEVVDDAFADNYLRELLALDSVEEESPALWSRYARQIVAICRRRNWREQDLPGARILVAYLLYWWGAFSRGYAFEVQIFRGLQRSGIRFQAHDLTDRRARYSRGDLIVSGMLGDIKTSVYFLQVAAPLSHDFYIVRLFVEGRSYTLAVMLQPEVWEEINGDTVAGTLDAAVALFPDAVRIKKRGHELVALDYSEWKSRILRLQRETG